MVRPVIKKPEKVKNQLLDDHTIVQSAFHGFPDTLKLKQEYLTRLAFFSSNSCLFASETDLRKNSSCPLGQFRCGKDGSNTLGHESLEFLDAKKSCVNKSAQLSKFYDTLYIDMCIKIKHRLTQWAILKSMQKISLMSSCGRILSESMKHTFGVSREMFSSNQNIGII